MPDNRRAPRRALTYLLAVPVIAIVYLGVFGTRIWSLLRPAVAAALGVTVIGSVYADEALKRAPATPVRAAAALALAVVLVGHGMAPAPASAAPDPAEAVIASARDYVGRGYQLGAEGPKQFDCSGLIYRAFLDAGELPRIGGMRLRAVGYLRWFVARGLFTRDVDKADRGDLVVWDRGEHIGIYLGDGKAISALVDPYGVTVHSLRGIHMPVDYFLQVDWRNGDGPGNDGPGNGDGDNSNNGNDGNTNTGKGNNDPGKGPGNGDSTGSRNDPGSDNTDPGDNPGNGDPGNGNGNPDPGNGDGNGDNPGNGTETDNPDPEPGNGDGDGNGNGDGDTQNGPPAPENPGAIPNGPRGGKQGYTTGTLNIRVSADPNARILGWLGRNRTVKITGQGNSPAGYLWYEVKTTTGKSGWVFSHWVRQL